MFNARIFQSTVHGNIGKAIYTVHLWGMMPSGMFIHVFDKALRLLLTSVLHAPNTAGLHFKSATLVFAVEDAKHNHHGGDDPSHK